MRRPGRTTRKASGTLHWADGESGEKTVVVPIRRTPTRRRSTRISPGARGAPGRRRPRHPSCERGHPAGWRARGTDLAGVRYPVRGRTRERRILALPGTTTSRAKSARPSMSTPERRSPARTSGSIFHHLLGGPGPGAQIHRDARSWTTGNGSQMKDFRIRCRTRPAAPSSGRVAPRRSRSPRTTRLGGSRSGGGGGGSTGLLSNDPAGPGGGAARGAAPLPESRVR